MKSKIEEIELFEVDGNVLYVDRETFEDGSKRELLCINPVIEPQRPFIEIQRLGGGRRANWKDSGFIFRVNHNQFSNNMNVKEAEDLALELSNLSSTIKAMVAMLRVYRKGGDL